MSLGFLTDQNSKYVVVAGQESLGTGVVTSSQNISHSFWNRPAGNMVDTSSSAVSRGFQGHTQKYPDRSTYTNLRKLSALSRLQLFRRCCSQRGLHPLYSFALKLSRPHHSNRYRCVMPLHLVLTKRISFRPWAPSHGAEGRQSFVRIPSWSLDIFLRRAERSFMR